MSLDRFEVSFQELSLFDVTYASSLTLTPCCRDGRVSRKLTVTIHKSQVFVKRVSVITDKLATIVKFDLLLLRTSEILLLALPHTWVMGL